MVTNFNRFITDLLESQLPRPTTPLFQPAVMQTPAPAPAPAPTPTPTPAPAPTQQQVPAPPQAPVNVPIVAATPTQTATPEQQEEPIWFEQLGLTGSQPPPQPKVRRTSDTYVYVLFQTPMGEAQVMLPKERTFSMPSSARIVGEPITDPERIQRAEDAGFLWEQLPPELQVQFKTREEASQTTMTAAQQREEQQNVVPEAIDPNTGQPLQPGQTFRPPENYPQSQASQIYPNYPGFTTQQLRETGDPDMVAYADTLEQFGISEVPEGMVPVITEDGKVELIQATVYEQQQREAEAGPGGTQARQTVEQAFGTFTDPTQQPGYEPPLTTIQIRQMGRNQNRPELEQQAAQLEAQGIFEIPRDQMVVQHEDGRLEVVPVAEQPPEGTTVFIYGGYDEPRERQSLDEIIMDTVGATGIVPGLQSDSVQDIVRGTGNVATGVLTEDWGQAARGVGQIYSGGRETVGTILEEGPEVLDYLRANVGAPFMGVIGRNVAEVQQSLENLWSNEVYPNLPEPVQWVIEHWIEPGAGVFQEILNNAQIAPGVTFGNVGDLIAPVAMSKWAAENPELVQQVYEQGYDADGDGTPDFTGNRAVWEAFVADQPWYMKALYDAQIDPLTAFSVGGAGLTRAGLRIAGSGSTTSFWRWLVGEGSYRLGRLLQLPDELIDRSVLGAIQAIYQGARRTPVIGQIIDRIADYTDDAYINIQRRLAESPIMEVIQRGRSEGPETTETRRMGPATEGGPSTGGTIEGAQIVNGQIVPRGRRLGQADEVGRRPGHVSGQQTVGTIERRAMGQATEADRITGDVVERRMMGEATELDTPTQVSMPRTRRTEVGPTTPTGQTRLPTALQVEPPQQTTTGVPLAETVPLSGEPARPFEGTSLSRPVEIPQEKPDWDFLTPTGRDETQDAPRLIDAVWDAREQHPERWRRFEQEYGPLAQRFRDSQRRPAGQRREGTVRQQAAHDAVEEARHIVTELLPTIERNFGDVMPLPEYRPRFGDDANPTNIEVQIERAIFHPDDTVSNEYMETIRGNRFVVKRNDGSVTFRRRASVNKNRPSDDIIAQVETLRNQYRSRYLRQAQVPSAPVAEQAVPTPEPQQAMPTTEPQQAQVTPQAAEPAPQAAPVTTQAAPEGMQPASGYFSVDPDTIQVDEARFQPRGGLNERRVAEIAENFQPSRAEAVIVWRDPADNQLYVLSGHHRLAAAQRAKAAGNADAARLDVRLFEGTENEAIQIAAGGNLGRTSQRPMELWRSYQMRRSTGMSEAEAREGIDNFTKIEQASHLSPNMQRALDASYDDAAELREGLPAITLNKAARLGRTVKQGYMAPEAAEAFWQRNPRLSEMSDRRFSELMNTMDNLHELNQAGIATKQSEAATLFDMNTIARDNYSDYLQAIDSKSADIRRLRGELRALDRAETAMRTRGAEVSGEVDRIRQVIQDELEQINAEIQTLAQRPAGSQMIGFARTPQSLGQTVRDLTADVRTVAGQTVTRAMPNTVAARAARQEADRIRTRFGDSPDLTDQDYFRGRFMTQDEREFFSQQLTDDSGNPIDTVGERLDRYANEFVEQGMEVQDAEVRAAELTINDVVLERVKQDRPELYEKYQREVDKLTRGRNKVSKEVAQVRALGRAAADDPGLLRTYDTALAILREMALYNTLTGTRYILTQVVGNIITALLTGNAEVAMHAMSPASLRAAYNELQNHPRDLIKPTAQKLYEDLGLVGRDPSAVVKDEVTVVGRDLRLHQTTDKVFRLGRAKMPPGEARGGFRLSSIFANKHVRDFANAVDLSFRNALVEHHMRGNVALARDDFYRHVTDNLPQQISREDFDRLWEGMPDYFSADDVRVKFGSLGHRGWAERMARDWQNALSQIKKGVQAELERVFFSGEERNIDRWARRFVFFHYWMSRAAPLYTLSMMKNPAVLNAYLKMMEEMEETAQEYGPAVQGFVQFFKTPMGYNIFLRPDALIQMFGQFWEEAGYSPEGENVLGMFMRRAGVMFNPIISTVLNLSGSMGDTFAPDPLLLGQWNRLVEDGVNYARARGWLGPDKTSPVSINVNDIFLYARDYITDALEEFVPGIEHIPYRDQAVYNQRELNYVIQAVAEERGLDPLGPEAQAAIGNPENPLYQEAFRRMTANRMFTAGMRYVPVFGAVATGDLSMAVSPVVYPKARLEYQDTLNQQIAQLPEGPERDELIQRRSMANVVDPNAQTLRQETSAYFEIGDEQVRQAYQTYNDIRNGRVSEEITVGGRTVQPDWLNRQPDEVRQQWADSWADEQGYTEQFAQLREDRSAFIEGSQEYGGYLDWRDMVESYPGGPTAWWRDTAKANPNARRWYEDYTKNYTGAVKDFEKGLVTQQAYMNAVGYQPTYSAPSPIAVRDQSQVPYFAGEQMPGESGGGTTQRESGPTVESITEDLARYEAQVAEYNQILSNALGQPVNIDQLNPMARDAWIQNIRQVYGIEPPRLSGYAAEYMRWRQFQPEGQDSIAAYLEWRRRTQGYGSMRPDPTALPSIPAAR